MILNQKNNMKNVFHWQAHADEGTEKTFLEVHLIYTNTPSNCMDLVYEKEYS